MVLIIAGGSTEKLLVKKSMFVAYGMLGLTGPGRW